MRTNILPSELKVGQRVSLARYGSWGHVSTQGTYIVVKVNKLKAVLNRESDGYERTFSVKRNCEVKAWLNGKDYDNNTFIESLEQAAARQEVQHKVAKINGLWRELESAASGKRLETVKNVLAELEAMGIK